MSKLQTRIKLPAALFTGSLIFILVLLTLTDPINSIIYVGLFYMAFFVWLVASGHLLLHLQGQELSHRQVRSVYLASTLIIILLMFRSAKALSILDAVLLLIFAAGIFFYLSKR